MPLPKLPHVKIPAQVSKPKGGRYHFEAAVKRLAPYRGVWVNDDGSRRQLSQQLARRYIENIARQYNTNLYLESHAPRSAAVLKTIGKLRQRADALLRELAEVDVLTARIVYGEALRGTKTPSRERMVEAGDVFGLIPEGRQGSAWTKRVSGLVRTLETLAREVPIRWQGQGRAVIDTGAKRNHFTETEGFAKWRFLTDALHVYNQFKPGQASGTEENDLHQFANEIFEYATGREPNDGLLRPLRDLIKPTREEANLNARDARILDELKGMALGKTIHEMSDKELTRFNELQKELSRNFDRLSELHRITWPHAFPSDRERPPRPARGQRPLRSA